MLSSQQFFQMRKLLSASMREKTCPCGVMFYSCSERAVYHSSACRQRFYRQRSTETAQEPQQPQNYRAGDNEKLIAELIEKRRKYSRKLKAL